MGNLDRYNDRMLARAEAAWLEPDEVPAAATCPRCGNDLYDGDYVYESVEDGKMICQDCFEYETREHRKEVHEPEPDWDSMPGGYDSDI